MDYEQSKHIVVQLLKSWEYKNLKFVNLDFSPLKTII